jgi:hypothetical protein
MIEERKETSSNSNNADLNRQTSSRLNSSSSEDTPSVGDEGQSAGGCHTEEDDMLRGDDSNLPID